MQIALKIQYMAPLKYVLVVSFLAMIISFKFFADCRFSNALMYLI
jgi:hypothetical protein